MSTESNNDSELPAERPEDHVIVLFGATGDLAKRKLLPGLFHLDMAGMMPEQYRIVGTGRPGATAIDTEGFRAHAREAVDTFGRKEVDDESWERFARRLTFATAEAGDTGALVAAVGEAETGTGHARRLIYLAIPPEAFVPTLELLGESGLGDGAKVIVEKPFGRDFESACELNKALHSIFDEGEIFRMDHYLGKEAVLNLLAFRFGNGLFERVWDRNNIAYVQIDVPEMLDVGTRGGFYEQTGAYRDVVVTHLFHVAGFLAMEEPDHLDAASLREATDAVFRDFKPVDPARVLFGQYDGYRQVDGVAPDSEVETFVALELEIDNPRWRGVPFQLRAGKAMAQSRNTVAIGFKEPPNQPFKLSGTRARDAGANELVFELTDPGSISLCFLTKDPGASFEVMRASLGFRYAESPGVADWLEAYERLLHEALLGHHALFASAAGIERLWEISGPLLEHPPQPAPYERGSWGPDGIEDFLSVGRWRLPDHDACDVVMTAEPPSWQRTSLPVQA